MTRPTNEFRPEEVSEDEIYKFLTTHWQHQNQLSWSRLYVLIALESATLGGAFAARTNSSFTILLLALGTIVGFLIFLLILRDWDVRDARENMELLDKVHAPLNIRMIRKSDSIIHTGGVLIYLIIGMFVMANLGAYMVLK